MARNPYRFYPNIKPVTTTPNITPATHHKNILVIEAIISSPYLAIASKQD